MINTPPLKYEPFNNHIGLGIKPAQAAKNAAQSMDQAAAIVAHLTGKSEAEAMTAIKSAIRGLQRDIVNDEDITW